MPPRWVKLITAEGCSTGSEPRKLTEQSGFESMKPIKLRPKTLLEWPILCACTSVCFRSQGAEELDVKGYWGISADLD
eukprot:3096140-Amphidinium_carterae.1